MAWDDYLVDGVDSIDAVRWNAMITNQAGKSTTSHTHTEFNIYPSADQWYVYTDGTIYYAKNMKTGTIDYSGSDFDTIMASVIGDITHSGFIKLGTGRFDSTTGIVGDDKPIIIEGSGWGRGGLPTHNPGTVIESPASGAYYLMQFGAHGATVEGAGVRNIMFLNDPANTTCLGAVDLYNTVNSYVDHCYFYGFELGSSAMSAISIRGATDETVGGWCNRVTNNHIINPDIGVLLGPNANYCVVEGNNIEGSGTATAHGIKCDGTDAPIASPYGCYIAGNRIRNFDNGPSRGLWITAGSDNSGRHCIIGNQIFEGGIGIEIIAGVGIGDCSIIGNQFPTVGTKCTDNGNVKSFYHSNKGYLTDNWGASTGTGMQQTIAHGLGATPTNVSLTQTTSAITSLYLSAASDATNIYVLCTTTKTYQWRASL